MRGTPSLYLHTSRRTAAQRSAGEGGLALHLVSCMQLGVARHARRPQNRLSNEAERRSALPKWIMGGMDETGKTGRRRVEGNTSLHPRTTTTDISPDSVF